MPRTSIRPERLTPSPSSPLVRPQTAHARLAIGPLAAEGRVEVTPLGLLAIGGMVGAILLSVAPIIWAARAPRTNSAPAD